MRGQWKKLRCSRSARLPGTSDANGAAHGISGCRLSSSCKGLLCFALSIWLRTGNTPCDNSMAWYHALKKGVQEKRASCDVRYYNS